MASSRNGALPGSRLTPPLAASHGLMICDAMFGRAGTLNVLIGWLTCQVCSHCITNVDGLIPVSGWLAISVISRPNVNAPIRVPAPVHGSKVRLGSPTGLTTFGSLISSDLFAAGDA